MNKKTVLKGKLSLMTTMCLGIMTLGIGFILWGIFSIGIRPNYSIINDADVPLYKLTDTIIEESNDDGDATGDEPLYSAYPAEGDHIGSLIMPTLNLELPIFEGTSSKELKKGVGHFIQSVLPGEEDNSVLSGHRDTVFREIGELVIGDLLIVKTSTYIFTYEVSGTRIVDKDDRTVIVPTEHAVLTMSTCYPFYYVGPAPDRYIVSANLLSKTKA